MQETKRRGFISWVRKIHWGRATATYSSILSWKIWWAEKPGGLQSIGLQRLGHDWIDLACIHYMCLFYNLAFILLPQGHSHFLFSSRSFIAFGFRFQCLIYVLLILSMVEHNGLRFILLLLALIVLACFIERFLFTLYYFGPIVKNQI